MSAQFVRPVTLEEEQLLHDRDLKNKRFGLQLWRLTNGMVFVFFVFAYYLLRNAQASWPPEGVARIDGTLPAILSVVLLLSAWPATRVLATIRQDKPDAMQRNLIATVVLGLIFLVGLTFVWRQIPHGGSYSAIYLAMTGFHAFHVLVGMGLFAYVFWKSQQQAYTKVNHWAVEAAVVFWHFVELMWIFFFLVLYVF